MAWVYILTVTGGIVQGDRLHTEIVGRDGAQVHPTTPTATKIYRSPAAPASHRLSIRAGAGTHVEYLPGPVIPFRGSRFLEEVTLVAHPTATLVYGGILSSGRVAMGESHAYALFSSRVTAQRDDGTLAFLDVTHLVPARISPKRPGLLGKFDVLGPSTCSRRRSPRATSASASTASCRTRERSWPAPANCRSHGASP